jgi:hypothetical protein
VTRRVYCTILMLVTRAHSWKRGRHERHP